MHTVYVPVDLFKLWYHIARVSGSTTYQCYPWRWTAGMSRQVRDACPSRCPRGPASCTAHRSSVDPTPGGHIVIILFHTLITKYCKQQILFLNKYCTKHTGDKNTMFKENFKIF